MQTKLFEPGYEEFAHQISAELRARASATRETLPNSVPVWVVHRYEAARRCLADPALSKSAALVTAAMRPHLIADGQTGRQTHMFDEGSMHMADPPVHGRLRAPVSSWFSRRQVAEHLATKISNTTEQLLDAIPCGDIVDLVDRVAFPLPATIICEILGVPVEDQDRFRPWVAAMMSGKRELSLPASDALGEYLRKLIEAKRETPSQDLLSSLLTDVGSTLTDEEIFATAVVLLVAGHETSQHLIGNTVVALLRTGAWRQLVEDPSLADQAVRETVRWDSPVGWAPFRVTTTPVDLGDVVIPAGEVVLISLLASNRDPDKFAQADHFDLGRDTSGQLAFGHGIHHCLGMAVGMAEAVTAVGQLVRRFPGLHLAVDPKQLQRRHSEVMFGWARLPVIASTAGAE